MLRIIIEFEISSLCFVHFSSAGQDGPDPAVDGEACSPLVEYACTLVDTPLYDMTLFVIKSRRNFVIDSSTVVSSSDIHTQD